MFEPTLRLWIVALAASIFAIAATDAKRFTQPYDCYVIFGKIQRCYDGRSNDLTQCVISSRLPSDQTVYLPQSMGGQPYPFGTSVATIQTVDGRTEKINVATFTGVCE